MMPELKLRPVVAADMEGKGYTHHLSSFGKPYKIGDVIKISGEHYLVEIAANRPDGGDSLREALEGVQFENMGDLSPLNAAYCAKQIMLGAFDAALTSTEEKGG